MFLTAKKIFTATAILSILNLTVEASFFEMLNIPEPENKVYAHGQTPNIIAVWELFKESNYMMQRLAFWQSLMVNLQVNTDNALSGCVTEIDTYVVMYREVNVYMATDTLYQASVVEKGTGTATTYGYYMTAVTKYADIVVEMTNVYNEC